MKTYSKITFAVIATIMIFTVLLLIFNVPYKATAHENEIINKYTEIVNNNTYNNLCSPYHMYIGKTLFLNLYENDNIVWVEDNVNEFGYYEFEKTDYEIMYNGFISKQCSNRNISEFKLLTSLNVFYEDVHIPQYDQKFFLNIYGYDTDYYCENITENLKDNLTHLFTEVDDNIKSYTVFFLDSFSWDRTANKYISVFVIADNGDVISSIIEQNGSEWIIPMAKDYANIKDNQDYKYTYSIIDNISFFKKTIVIEN